MYTWANYTEVLPNEIILDILASEKYDFHHKHLFNNNIGWTFLIPEGKIKGNIMNPITLYSGYCGYIHQDNFIYINYDLEKNVYHFIHTDSILFSSKDWLKMKKFCQNFLLDYN